MNTIGRTIYQQLIYTTPSTVLFSWGFRNPVIYPNHIEFRVSGFLHNGIVKIIYNQGKDLYEVELWRGKTLKKSHTDVYFDEMSDLIDSIVEHDGNSENYRKKVSKMRV